VDYRVNRIAAYALVLLAAVSSSFLAGRWWSDGGKAATAADTEDASGYMCPMHHEYTSAHAGNCAVCGMRLVARSSVGVVYISTEMQRRAGVEVAAVESASVEHTLRLVGRVVAEDAATHVVTAGVGGFVRDLSRATTGSWVRKGEQLAAVIAPDAFPAIQSYIVALDAIDRLRQDGEGGAAQAQISSVNNNFQLRQERLEDLGMSDAQIAELRRTREVPTSISVVAPADGFVLSRHISPGQRFERGAEWYRIVDLRRVWIMAEMIGPEADFVQPGSRARVAVPGRAARLDALVSTALPLLDENSRTLRVRLEADNAQYVLRPDMLVEVELAVTLPAMTVVPSDAVLDSGRRQRVFVELAGGMFAARDVKTRLRVGDRVEIVEGLAPGDRIVTSGTFLVDSESRMTRAVEDLAGTHNH
jgi:RND family efflux transporter MFP subunit